MSRLDAALALASRALLGGAALAVLAMTALVARSVFMRYLVDSPFAFTEELVALLYLAMVFFTIPIGTLRREHVVVTVCVERAGPRLQRVLRLAAAVVMIVFTFWFVCETYAFTAFSRKLEARSDHVGILLWPWMAIMPATVALVGVIAAVRGWQSLRNPRVGIESAPGNLGGDRL